MNHSEEKIRKKDARDRSNIFSTITYFYTFNLFKKAYKSELNVDDLYQAPDDLKSESCGKSLEKSWKKRKERSKFPTALGLLWRHFGKFYLFLGVVDLSFHIFYATLQPLALSKFIDYFSTDTELTKDDAFYYAGLMLVLNFCRIFFMHNYSLIIMKFALKVRTSFTALLYRKILKISPKALNDISLGNIVTIVTKDVASFEKNVFMVNDMIFCTLECGYVTYLIYSKIGPVTFVGIGIMIGVLPLQGFLAKLVVKWRLKMAKKTDERLQVLQETLSAIKIIKMCVWEKAFEKKLFSTRIEELKLMIKVFYLQIIVYLIGSTTSKIAFFSTILAYINMGYPARAELVYYVLSCFSTIQGLWGISIPYGWTNAAEMYAALIRLNTVLNAEEVEKNIPTQKMDGVALVDLDQVTVKKNLLEKVTAKATNGMMVVVTGPIGLGKSLLLKTILREYSGGCLKVKGSISYACQDPWLFPTTIRQNILFGEKYNEQRYKEVIRVCALQYDFDVLDYGDDTIVADKGMNLSKGQQARINLARAVYRNSDIYLLDDPLTSLDGKIQDYIFNECIKNFLKEKLVVLVSQYDKHIHQADKVWIVDDGKLMVVDHFSPKLTTGTTDNSNGFNEESLSQVENEKNSHKPTDISVYQESTQEGAVPLKHYISYIKLGGGFLLLFVVFMFCVGSQATSSYLSTLLTKWVDLNQEIINLSNNTNSTEYQETVDENRWTINMYMYMLGALVFMDFGLSGFHLVFVKRSAQKIHKLMATSVINAVMSFFDFTFIGNILNRFSQDLSIVDELLAFRLLEMLRVPIEIIAIIIVITHINWKFLPLSFVFIVFAVLLRFLYIPAGRSLRRLECTTRSPMIGHLNCSLEGLTTIRAFNKQKILTKEMDEHQDLYTSARFMSYYTNRGFAFLLDVTCVLLLSIIIIRFLFFDTEISAGSVGLGLTQVMGLSDTIQWGVRQWSETENQMTSFERVMEYTKIKQEDKSGKTLKDWPKKGSIKFKDVCLNYSKNEKVLRDVTFDVQSGQKVGIVGRTGAGKSSFVSSLFRLYPIQGDIYIDDLKIKDLALDFLRKNIVIIPQDPVLFSGSIRFNLDPNGTFSDEEIWRAIDKVEMKDLVGKLDDEILCKSDFSAGQRQLLCLARAIILESKIVVLDEASANLDAKTEKILQRVIKENFSNSTLFLIAHRLNSIIDSDKILVLDNGEVVEFDSPRILLKNINSYFYNMMGRFRRDV